jgi:adenylate kinase family enzyme
LPNTRTQQRGQEDDADPIGGRVRSLTVDRVVVIGNGGSGKTHLARRLATRLDLPLTHLDAEYYDDAWQPCPPEAFAARQRRLVARPRWVIEGNYAATLPIRLAAADTLVFLDLPAATCLAGIAQRRLRYRGGQHPDGVYDRITVRFLRYVAGYRRTMRPRIRQLVADHGRRVDVVVLTSRRQADRWLAALPVI